MTYHEYGDQIFNGLTEREVKEADSNVSEYYDFRDLRSKRKAKVALSEMQEELRIKEERNRCRCKCCGY